jgi:hypothetical protein
MEWFRDKSKKQLYILLAEETSQKETRLVLINVSTNRISSLVISGNCKILEAFMDEGPQRVLIHIRRKGTF